MALFCSASKSWQCNTEPCRWTIAGFPHGRIMGTWSPGHRQVNGLPTPPIQNPQVQRHMKQQKLRSSCCLPSSCVTFWSFFPLCGYFMSFFICFAIFQLTYSVSFWTFFWLFVFLGLCFCGYYMYFIWALWCLKK